MLTPIIIKRKLAIGKICKSEEESHVFWYIPVCVKANCVWNLLTSDIGDVKAIVTFVQQSKNKEVCHQAPWVNPNLNDSPSITLRIGSEHQIRLVEDWDGSIVPGGKTGTDNALVDDYDILLRPKSVKCTNDV